MKNNVVAIAYFCLALSLLIQLHPMNAQSEIIRPPEFLSISQQPLEPPPGYPTNITAVVNSSRPIVEVVLHFSTLRVNESIPMVFVAGNMTYASYYAVIPPQVLNSIVSYYVLAVDRSGFQGVSTVHKFLVEKDETGPTLELEYTPHSVLSPNLRPISFSQTDIRVIAKDAGAGVKDVVIRYSNSTSLNDSINSALFYGPVPYRVAMALVRGDRYDGVWEGLIPALPDNTRVVYEVEAVDFANNPSTVRYSYFVSPLPSLPDAHVQIVLQKLDLVSQTMTVTIVITSTYPTRYLPSIFSAQIIQLVSENLTYYGNVTYVSVRNNGGIFYQGSWDLKIPLEPRNIENLYPFDYYYVGFNVTLWVGGLAANNTRSEFYVTGLPYLDFDQQLITTQTLTDRNSGLTRISILYRLDRKLTLVNPIMQAIYAVFILLGLTTWLPYRRKYLGSRITFLSGLFTFVVFLYFTVSEVLSQQQGLSGLIGLPVPLLLLIGLVWCITLFLGASLIFARIIESFDISSRFRIGSHTLPIAGIAKHILNIGLSFLALILMSIFGRPEVVFYGQSATIAALSNPADLIETSVFWELPVVREFVLVGLFGPLILLIVFELIFLAARLVKARIKNLTKRTAL